MNLFDFYIPEWFFVALNLFILIFILKAVLWKPVSKILENRQERVSKTEQDAAEAARLRAEMEQLRSQLEADMETRTTELMKEARSRAGKEYDRIVLEAETKAELIISTAKTKAEHERESMMVEIKGQIVSVAMEAAGLLLRSNMDSERNKRLVEAFLNGEDVSA